MALLTVLMFHLDATVRTTGAAHPHPAPVCFTAWHRRGQVSLDWKSAFTERLQQIGR
jgi:hypothetical protein